MSETVEGLQNELLTLLEPHVPPDLREELTELDDNFEMLHLAFRYLPPEARAEALHKTWTRGHVAVPDGYYRLEDSVALFEAVPELKETAAHLPEKLTVYRGVSADNAVHAEARCQRLSWTLDPGVALSFCYALWAPINTGEWPYLATAQVGREHVLAAFHDYLGQAEVIVDPRKVTIRSVVKQRPLSAETMRYYVALFELELEAPEAGEPELMPTFRQEFKRALSLCGQIETQPAWKNFSHLQPKLEEAATVLMRMRALHRGGRFKQQPEDLPEAIKILQEISSGAEKALQALRARKVTGRRLTSKKRRKR